jgi:hypothetical protein
MAIRLGLARVQELAVRDIAQLGTAPVRKDNPQREQPVRLDGLGGTVGRKPTGPSRPGSWKESGPAGLSGGHGQQRDEFDAEIGQVRPRRPPSPTVPDRSRELRITRIALVVISILAVVLFARLVANEVRSARQATPEGRQLPAGSPRDAIMPDDTAGQQPSAPPGLRPDAPSLAGPQGAPAGSMQPDAGATQAGMPMPAYQRQPSLLAWSQGPGPLQSMQPVDDAPADQQLAGSPLWSEPSAAQASAASLQPGADEYGSVQQEQGYADDGQSQQADAPGQPALPVGYQAPGQQSYPGSVRYGWPWWAAQYGGLPPMWPLWAPPPLVTGQSAFGLQGQGLGNGASGWGAQLPVTGGGSMQPE